MLASPCDSQAMRIGEKRDQELAPLFKGVSTMASLHSIRPHTLKSLYHSMMPWAEGQASESHFRSRSPFHPVSQVSCRILSLVSSPHIQEEMLIHPICRTVFTLSMFRRSVVIEMDTHLYKLSKAGGNCWVTLEKETLLLPPNLKSFSRELYQVLGGKVHSSDTKDVH